MRAPVKAVAAGGPDRPLLRSLLASELRARVASAVVLAAMALLSAFHGGWPLKVFWLLAGIAVAAEWTAVTRVEPLGPMRATAGLGLTLLAATALLQLGLAAGLAVLGGTAAVLLALGSGRRDGLWASAGLACAAVLVLVPPLVRDDPALGLSGLLWMFAVVWTTDVAAFFTGRRFGGPKLWPAVSPKKTWSGFGGGLLAGTAAGVATASVAARLGWPPVAGLSLVALVSAAASALSQLGDLGESALKRLFNVKDSGRLIPGHGGVMDRLDGFWSASLLVGLLLVPLHLFA